MVVTNRMFIASDIYLKLVGFKDNSDGSFINAADSVEASVFKNAAVDIDEAEPAVSCHLLAFTGGGGSGSKEITVGMSIEGATGGATAVVEQVEVGSGTWEGGDAAGDLHISNQVGTFQSEDLNDAASGGDTDIATIAGDSTAGQRTKIEATGHDMDVSNLFVRVVGTNLHNGQWDAWKIDSNNIIIDKTYVAETFDDNDQLYVGLLNGKDIALAYVSASDGDYEGTLPETIGNLTEGVSYAVFVTVIYGSLDFVIKKRLAALFHPGT